MKHNLENFPRDCLDLDTINKWLEGFEAELKQRLIETRAKAFADSTVKLLEELLGE